MSWGLTLLLAVLQVDRWGGFILNFIHYEDAASLAVAVGYQPLDVE